MSRPDRTGDDVPLVGRATPLRILAATLREVEQGETAAVFVTGESGVGKSQLIKAALPGMREADAVVLSGACLDIGDAPLHPLRQALRQHKGEANAERVAGELLALLDGEVAGIEGAGALLERLSAGLYELSNGQPLVLAIDDLQWVDRTTRGLLRYLLAGLGGIRLLVLGVARVQTLAGDHPVRSMLSELRRLPSVRVLDLQPLSSAETEELATAIVGRSLEPDEADLLWTRSRGNPFVAEALARGLRDGQDGLPETLREIATARVLALPKPSFTVALAVAAGVEPVEHALLRRVLQFEEEQLIDAARTAVDQRILDATAGGYGFHLGLFKEALEFQLLPGESVHLHRRYAETLAASPAAELQQARLAHHWRLAGEPGLALPAAISAARRAEFLYGYAEAFACWTVALRVIDEARPGDLPTVDRTEVRRAAAEAAHRSGEHAWALAILRQVAIGIEGPLPCWLHIRRARYLTAIGRAADADAEYKLALAVVDCTVQDKAEAAAHSADLLIHLGKYAEAGQRAREALDIARGVGQSTSSVVLAGAALGFSQAYLNDPVAGRAAVQEALETAERLGTPDDVARAHLHLAELLTGPLNKLGEGVEVARRGAQRAKELGLGRTHGARLLAVAANGLFRSGDWAEAEKVIEDALRQRPSGAEAVELLLARCRVYIGYGDLDAAETDLDAIETLTEDGGARHVLPLLTLRAGLAMWRGQQGLARAAVRKGLRLYEGRSDDIVLQATLLWHGLRAEADAHGRDESDQDTVTELREGAERAKQRSLTAARPVRDAVAGFLALCDAEITRIEGASDPVAWDAAATVWEQRNHPYPAAYALLRQAEALYAQRTRNAKADAALRQSYQVARRLGARPLTDEVKSLAERARVQLPEPLPITAVPHEPPGPAQGQLKSGRTSPLAVLTVREHEVLALVADGMTNQKIGELLFISPRTVGVHVSHILARLQVKSRVQASAIYQRSHRP